MKRNEQQLKSVEKTNKKLLGEMRCDFFETLYYNRTTCLIGPQILFKINELFQKNTTKRPGNKQHAGMTVKRIKFNKNFPVHAKFIWKFNTFQMINHYSGLNFDLSTKAFKISQFVLFAPYFQFLIFCTHYSGLKDKEKCETNMSNLCFLIEILSYSWPFPLNYNILFPIISFFNIEL